MPVRTPPSARQSFASTPLDAIAVDQVVVEPVSMATWVQALGSHEAELTRNPSFKPLTKPDAVTTPTRSRFATFVWRLGLAIIIIAFLFGLLWWLQSNNALYWAGPLPIWINEFQSWLLNLIDSFK